MINVFQSGLLAAALLTSAGAIADSSQPYVSVTRMGISTTTFSCGGTGICHYLLLNSLCQEKMLDNGTKERTCRYTEAAPRFTLTPGQRKTVANLPADFLYGMKMNSAPTFEEVLRAPTPH